MDSSISSKWLVNFSEENKGLCVSNSFENQYNFNVNISLDGDLQKDIIVFSIIKNDEKLFELVEFVFDNLTKKNNVLVVGKNIQIYVFSCCFTRRWNKYSLEKSIEYIKSTVFFERKIKIPLYVEKQLQRYNPPLCILVCGARDISRCFDKIIEREIKKLPKRSIVYCGKNKGVDEKTREICKKLNIECEVFLFEDDDLKYLSFDFVYAFHEEIEKSRHTMKIIRLAYNHKIESYIFDLKHKEKFEGNKFIYVEYI